MDQITVASEAIAPLSPQHGGPLLLLGVLLIAPFFLPLKATAQKVLLNVHGPSWHSEGAEANNHTWGLGVEGSWKDDSWQYGVLAGAFHNSHGNRTMYAGAAGSYLVTTWAQVGIGLAGATGYENKICFGLLAAGDDERCFHPERTRGILPMLWPFLSLGKRVQVRMLATPLMGGAAHFVLSLRLN